MVTPEDARGLADVIEKTPICKSDKYVTEALRDLASQIDSLKEDAERLAFINAKLEWDGHGYWMPEWCIVGIEGQQEMIGHPSIDKFREAIDAARKQS